MDDFSPCNDMDALENRETVNNIELVTQLYAGDGVMEYGFTKVKYSLTAEVKLE